MLTWQRCNTEWAGWIWWTRWTERTERTGSEFQDSKYSEQVGNWRGRFKTRVAHVPIITACTKEDQVQMEF